MMKTTRRFVLGYFLFFVMVSGLSFQNQCWSFAAKEQLHNFDKLVHIAPQLRLPVQTVEIEMIKESLPQKSLLNEFRTEYGQNWSLYLDVRRNVASLLKGGAIPFIPGKANSLKWDDFEAACSEARCIPPQKVVKLSQDFLVQHQELLGIDPTEMELVENNPIAVEHMYFINFRQVVDDVPVENALVGFRINRGNLIGISTQRVAPVQTVTAPTIQLDMAWDSLGDYLGDFPTADDEIQNPGSLLLVPITPWGLEADNFTDPVGSGIDHVLCYRIVFTRIGVIGTWEALIDAHTGEVFRFVDINRYGTVHGTVYTQDGHTISADRVFPFASVDFLYPEDYCTEGGLFPGDTATIFLYPGKYVEIQDLCGDTSLTTTNGNADYGESVGTDCDVPNPNPGGPGNTWSGKTMYYHLVKEHMKALRYYPSNTFLNEEHIFVRVNAPAACNAYSTGPGVYFFKAYAPCWNLGELPGVGIHEWGHSWDTYDGSGGESPPVETRADWQAIIKLHDSCGGRGGGAPSCGYGDTCLNCDGFRDSDYWQHSNQTPWTASNHGTFWGPCGSGSYQGPCGLEDHCESGIASQALWDMVRGDNTAPEPDGDFFTECGLDSFNGWQLIERLFLISHAQLGDMYNCSGMVTDGCGGNTLYELFMSIDDEGDGVANGTPHAAGIFAALNRHEIACGTVSDPQNQNSVNPTCPTLGAVQDLTTIPLYNQMKLTWTSLSNADRYDIFRSDDGCDWGFFRISQVEAPLTEYIDTSATLGYTYYYRIQAYAENLPDCTGTLGLFSDCVSDTPQDCGGSITLDNTLYTCSDTINVTVFDATANNPLQYVQVEAWSTTDPTPKTIILSGDPQIEEEFTGSFTTTSSSSPGPTEVSVADGDILTVQYTDPDFCGTPDQTVQMTAIIDCIPPIIANVQVINITDTSVTITWETDERANMQLLYGLSAPPGQSKSNPLLYNYNHSMDLNNLISCSTYYVRINSEDVAGNVGTYPDPGPEFTFDTLGRAYVFLDDMESGVNGWSTTGLWHQVSEPICFPSATSGVTSWFFGEDATCMYDTGLVESGRLISPVIGKLSPGTYLHLNYRMEREHYCGTGVDERTNVQISTDGGYSWTDLWWLCIHMNTFYPSDYIDLSAYTDQDVQIGFFFQSDDPPNPYLGWMVDDVEVSYVAPCGIPILQLESLVKNDSCAAGGAGNGDGIIDAGERIMLEATVRNEGLATATGITATLNSSSPGVYILDDQTSFVDLDQLERGTSIFIFQVDSDVVCGTFIDFSIVFTSNEDSWIETFTFEVGHSIPPTFILLSEDFESSWGTYGDNPPPGWTIEDYGSETPPEWNANDWYRGVQGAPYYQYARASLGATPYEEFQDEWLITPLFDLPLYSSSTDLEFDYIFIPQGHQASIDYQSDQHPSWTTLVTYSLSHESWTHETISLQSYAGDTNCRIRFRYTNNLTLCYWTVDNVTISGTYATTCFMNTCPFAADVLPDSPTTVCAGENMVFSTAISGGSGIYSYQWTEDGVIMPNKTNTSLLVQKSQPESHVYNCQVTDTVNYPDMVNDPADSTGVWQDCNADIVYYSNLAPVELEGDGDGVIEAGEKWQLSVTVTNIGTADATDVLGSLDGEGLLVCNNPGNFGDIPVFETGIYVFEFIPDPNVWYGTYACNSSIGFDLIDKFSDSGFITYSPDIDFTSETVGSYGSPVILFSDDFSTLFNWTQDPASSTTLQSTTHCVPHSSDYARLNGLDATLTHTESTAGYSKIQIIFDQVTRDMDMGEYLNLEWYDGFTWRKAWSGAPTSWQCSQTITLPTTADDLSNFQIRFRNDSDQRSEFGMFDEIIVMGSPINCDTGTAACETCLDPVGFNPITVTDIDQCQCTGLMIEWPVDPADWGDSSSGTRTYEIIRESSIIRTGISYGTTVAYDLTAIADTTYTYYVRYKNGCDLSAMSPGVQATDQANSPGTPVLSVILDNDSCAQSGVTIYFNPGSGADDHELYIDGAFVMTGITSPYAFNPGDTSSHEYVVRATSEICFADSSPVTMTDNDHTPVPTIVGPTSNSCPDTTVILTTESGMGAYQWYLDDIAITGATNEQYEAHTSGDYTVSYFNIYECPGTSNIHMVTITSCLNTVPNGTEGSTVPMTVIKTGTDVTLTWDVLNCTSPDYHLLWGWGDTIAAYSVADSKCDLGMTGSYDWTNPPDTSSNWIWFLIVGDDENQTEGGWGTDSNGASRQTSASGECGCLLFDPTTCTTK